jgi:hypothetical protein
MPAHAINRNWKARQARDVAKEENRRTLARLRADVKAARLHRDEALEEVRGYCRRLREETSAGAANTPCAAHAAEKAKEWAPALDRSLRAVAGERAHQLEVENIERTNRSRKRAAPKASRKERQSESDDDVRANIPEELVPLFEKVKRQIKGSARRSRTEEFLDFVHDHPEMAIDYDEIEDETERMIAQHEAELRSGRRNPPRTGKLAELASGELETSEIRELAAKLLRAAEKERDRKWRAGEDPAVADAREAKKRAAIFEAREAGEAAVKERRSREIAALDVKIREERRMRPNPGLELVELGKLTAIVWEGGSRRWQLSKAPILAYAPKTGRLFIVFTARVNGRASTAERREYARTHWGEGGKGQKLSGYVLDRAPTKTLGLGMSITYTTRKGSNELVDWIHEWGEGARGKWTAPAVVEHVCHETPKCAGHGTIALRGGTYRVTERGIVG